MSDLLELVLGLLVDTGLETAGSPRAPWWARLLAWAVLIVLPGIPVVLLLWVGLDTANWGLVLLGGVLLGSFVFLLRRKQREIRRRKKNL